MINPSRWTSRTPPILMSCILLLVPISNGFASDDGIGAHCAASVAQMSYCELQSLYRSLSAVEIPGGYYRGTVLVRKEKLRKAAAGMTRTVWQGKFIYPCQGKMVNRVLGKPAVPADLSMGNSWLDGGPSQIFDYACSPAKFARDARDEVREICPGLYLGIMYLREDCNCPRLANFFLLEQDCCP